LNKGLELRLREVKALRVRRVFGCRMTLGHRDTCPSGFALAAPSFFDDSVNIVAAFSSKLVFNCPNLIGWIRNHLQSPGVAAEYKLLEDEIHPLGKRWRSLFEASSEESVGDSAP